MKGKLKENREKEGRKERNEKVKENEKHQLLIKIDVEEKTWPGIRFVSGRIKKKNKTNKQTNKQKKMHTFLLNHYGKIKL